MATRLLGPAGGRRKRLALFVPIIAIAALILAIGASAGAVGTAAGFEDDDGNLAPDPAGINFDWNSFGSGANGWVGTAPKRTRDEVVSGWAFKGIEDYQSSGSDDGFAGGTKQDDECASVISHVANNKEDLKRIYLATKTISGHIYLMLSWIRIPQNSTSNSSNVGFEFNRGSTSCGAGSDGLVHRSVDTLSGAADNSDMLIVYDFAGGTALPIIRLLRWEETGSCDAGGTATVADPCWVSKGNLTALGFAEGKVNTGATASDTVAPSNETLGLVEFGEAGIDLTNAGVFTPGVCESFGTAYGVSRTSGNSANAQMKDIVGPAPFTLSNCGQIKIIKHSNPRGLDQNFGFDSTIPNTSTCTADTTPSGAASPDFLLNDKSIGISAISAANPAVVTTTVNHGFASGQTVSISGSNSTPSINGNQVVTVIDATHFSVPVNVTTAGSAGSIVGDSSRNTENCVDVPAGTYTVTEAADPTGFQFNNYSCSASGTGTSYTAGATSRQVSITIAGGGVVICTYTNDQQLGAIKLTKIAKNANCGGSSPPTGCSSGKAPVSGAVFQLCSNQGPYTPQNPCTQVGSNQSTGSDGKTCFNNLAFGTYYVHEVSASGYQLAADQSETIASGSTCANTTHVPTFENVPLSSIQVKFTSLAGAGITNAQIVCKTGGVAVGAVSENGSDDNDSTPVRDDSDETFTNLPGSGVYNCTIDIDP